MILIAFMYALFAAEFPLAKFALRETNAFFLEMMRMLIGGTILLAYYGVRGNTQLRIAREDWSTFAQLIIFYIYLSYFSAGWALQYMSSLKANIVCSLVPFVSALLAYIILRDRLTMQKVVGMVVGAFGLIMILAVSDRGKILAGGEFMTISLPEIMMLVSIFSTEYGYFLLKRLYDKGYPLILINGLAMFIGGSLSLMSAFLFFEQQIIYYTSFWSVVGYAVLLFLIANVIDIALYGTLIKKYSITFLTFASFLSPIFGVIYGTIFMGESILPMHGCAFSLIFFGLYLFLKSDAMHNKLAGKVA